MLSRPVPNSVWSSNQLQRWQKTQNLSNSPKFNSIFPVHGSLKIFEVSSYSNLGQVEWSQCPFWGCSHLARRCCWCHEGLCRICSYTLYTLHLFWHTLHSDFSPCIFSSFLGEECESARLTELVVWLKQMGQLENLCLANRKPFEHLLMEGDITKITWRRVSPSKAVDRYETQVVQSVCRRILCFSL